MNCPEFVIHHDVPPCEPRASQMIKQPDLFLRLTAPACEALDHRSALFVNPTPGISVTSMTHDVAPLAKVLIAVVTSLVSKKVSVLALPGIHTMGTMTSCASLFPTTVSTMKHIAMQVTCPWDPGVYTPLSL